MSNHQHDWVPYDWRLDDPLLPGMAGFRRRCWQCGHVTRSSGIRRRKQQEGS